MRYYSCQEGEALRDLRRMLCRVVTITLSLTPSSTSCLARGTSLSTCMWRCPLMRTRLTWSIGGMLTSRFTTCIILRDKQKAPTGAFLLPVKLTDYVSRRSAELGRSVKLGRSPRARRLGYAASLRGVC